MTDKLFKILLLEDNVDDALLIEMYIKRAGIQFKMTDTTIKEEFIQALEKEEFDLIICDHGLPSFDSLGALKMARDKYPCIPFIIVSGKIPDEKVSEILIKGADEYVAKDCYKSLGVIIRRVLENRSR